MAYSISGTVKESTTSIERVVRLYNRSTGALVDSTNSTDGTFAFAELENIQYQVVCLDDSAGTEYNDLIYRCLPAESEQPQINEYHTAKSVIIDIADNWGDGSFICLRKVDFYYQGQKIALTTSEFTAYSTTQFPSSRDPENAFDDDTNYSGGGIENEWMSANAYITNQRLICVFNNEIQFDSIVINNGGAIDTAGAADTVRSIKNTKIYISTDEITDTTYDAAITNSSLIFDGQVRERIDVDVRDDIDIPISRPWSTYENVKSIVVDIADGWGSVNDALAVRQIDFYSQGIKHQITSSNATAYATSYADSRYLPIHAFDTTTVKTGSYVNNCEWFTTPTVTNQRLICVLDSQIDIDSIAINNSHLSGTGQTDNGIKNIKIYASADEITDTTYNSAITNSTLIFDGQVEQHITYDVVDDQVIDIETNG